MTTSQLLNSYFVLMLIGATGALGDVSLYRWAQHQHIGALLAGMLSWGISLLLFAGLLRYGHRSLGATFILSAVIHIVAVLGYEYFASNRATSRLEWMGLLLAAAGILLIEYAQFSTAAPE